MSASKEGIEGETIHNEVIISSTMRTPQVSCEDLHHEIAAYENRTLDFRTVMGIIALAFTYDACLFSFVLPVAVLLTINDDIGPSAQLNWVATVWSLSSAVILTIAGRCSDIFGRRNFTLAGNLLGLVGCVISCRASNVNTIIAGMTLTGIGSGAQQLASAAASEIVPKKARGLAMAFLSMAGIAGSAFGAVIAYALVANLSWRWTFYVGIISNGWALVLVAIFYWPPGFIGLHPEGKSRLQQFKELDFVGLLLFGGGLTSLLLGLSWGNNPYPWRSITVLLPLILGALCTIVAFPLWELHCSEKIAKLCPPALFRNVRGFTLPLIVIFVSGMLLISLQVYWPQEVQLLFTTVPRTVGWYSLAYNGGQTMGAITTGILFAKIRRTKWQFVVVTVMQAIFISSLASVTQHTPQRAIVFVAISSFCVGASQIIGLLFVQFGADGRHIGVATGLAGSMRFAGGAVGVAIYGSIIREKAANNIAPKVAAAAIHSGLPASEVESFLVALTSHSVTALDAVKGITPSIIAAGADAIKDVYTEGFKLVFLSSLAFGGLSIIAAIFVRSVDDALTSETLVQLDAPHLIGHGRGEAMIMHKDEDNYRAT